jgi:hypothetical protein
MSPNFIIYWYIFNMQIVLVRFSLTVYAYAGAACLKKSMFDFLYYFTKINYTINLGKDDLYNFPLNSRLLWTHLQEGLSESSKANRC